MFPPNKHVAVVGEIMRNHTSYTTSRRYSRHKLEFPPHFWPSHCRECSRSKGVRSSASKSKHSHSRAGGRQQPSASIMLKRYYVDHPKAQRHPLFTLLDHTSAPVSFVGRCYAFIVGSASHEFASPLIVDVGGGDDAFVSIHAAFASTKFGW